MARRARPIDAAAMWRPSLLLALALACPGCLTTRGVWDGRVPDGVTPPLLPPVLP